MRTFIALELPAEVQAELSALQQELRSHLGAKQSAALPSQTGNAMRWVDASKMHLTLRFLGETNDEERERVQAELSALDRSGFELEWRGLGAFPSWQRPSVVWAGVEQVGGAEQRSTAPSALAQLQTDIERAVRRVGYPAETKPFRPHLTLARCRRDLSTAQRRALGRSLKEWQETQTPRGSSWTVLEFVYLRSQLGATGARYSELGRWSLAP